MTWPNVRLETVVPDCAKDSATGGLSRLRRVSVSARPARIAVLAGSSRLYPASPGRSDPRSRDCRPVSPNTGSVCSRARSRRNTPDALFTGTCGRLRGNVPCAGGAARLGAGQRRAQARRRGARLTPGGGRAAPRPRPRRSRWVLPAGAAQVVDAAVRRPQHRDLAPRRGSLSTGAAESSASVRSSPRRHPRPAGAGRRPRARLGGRTALARPRVRAVRPRTVEQTGRGLGQGRPRGTRPRGCADRRRAHGSRRAGLARHPDRRAACRRRRTGTRRRRRARRGAPSLVLHTHRSRWPDPARPTARAAAPRDGTARRRDVTAGVRGGRDRDGAGERPGSHRGLHGDVRP